MFQKKVAVSIVDLAEYMTQITSDQRYVVLERMMLILFIFLRVQLFMRFIGVAVGYDALSQITMTQEVWWTKALPSLDAFFYAYHPPLGFLIARSLMIFGISPLVSIQIVVGLASLFAFVCLRATLNTIDLLYRQCGIFFLYIGSSFPVQVFMARSVNLDVIILALTSFIIFVSVRYFWIKPQISGYLIQSKSLLIRNIKIWLPTILLVIAICVGLMTKFSGIKLVLVPFFVATTTSFLKRQKIIRSIAIGLVSICLVLPFYFLRYYVPTGDFFPGNEEWYIKKELTTARTLRDRDIGRFLLYLFVNPLPTFIPIKPPPIVVPSIGQTWVDLWLKNDLIESSSSQLRTISLVYKKIFGWLVRIGIFIWIIKKNNNNTTAIWWQFGILLAEVGFLEIVTLSAYVYKYPVWDYYPQKAIYVAPLTWLISFLVTTVIIFPRFPRIVSRISLIFVICFMVINHLLPVY